MISRRELIAASVAGSLTAAPVASLELSAAEQEADRQVQREIANQIAAVDRTLNSAFLSSSLAHGFVAKLRTDMEQFLRASGKFPDYIEIGVAVFFDIYDWHIKNQQQLTVTRTDGRYIMQFMFTSLILRAEQDRNYIGVPYDRA